MVQRENRAAAGVVVLAEQVVEVGGVGRQLVQPPQQRPLGVGRPSFRPCVERQALERETAVGARLRVGRGPRQESRQGGRVLRVALGPPLLVAVHRRQQEGGDRAA